MIPAKSLKTRMITVAFIVPAVILFIVLGGLPFAIFTAVALACGGWEFWRMFRMGNYAPSLFLMAGGILVLVMMRYFVQFNYCDLAFTVIVLLGMAFAVIQQTQAVPNAGFNYAITVSGIFYVGWLGSYAVSLRELPLGMIWTLVVIFAASMSDAGAYLFGSLFGRHKIAPALSPKKSWEGYFGGVLTAAGLTWAATLVLSHFYAGIDPSQGLILGSILAILTPLGDFAESMLKRLFNLKDTSHLLPGHGGILDRIDSSLWALPIGFYILTLLH